VEYSSKTQQLEVRVNYNDSRPITLLVVKKPIDLFDVAAEYMWVGFLDSNLGLMDLWVSDYYVRD
jgi:hypothetical protein